MNTSSHTRTIHHLPSKPQWLHFGLILLLVIGGRARTPRHIPIAASSKHCLGSIVTTRILAVLSVTINIRFCNSLSAVAVALVDTYRGYITLGRFIHPSFTSSNIRGTIFPQSDNGFISVWYSFWRIGNHPTSSRRLLFSYLNPRSSSSGVIHQR